MLFIRKITHRHLLIAILVLAVFTRFFRLGTPHDYVFDEVYHAYTAQEVVSGNIEAWEWWTDPPEQFAYEWTHPPMAKLMMGVGVRAFSWVPTNLIRIPNPTGGDPIALDTEGVYPDDVSPKGLNPIVWRIPVALFSVGIVYLLYLLGKELFSPRVGLIAAFLATFDGLLFVMGRIGMNDTFFLFFQLGAVLMLVRWLKCDRSTASRRTGLKNAQDDKSALRSLAVLSKANLYLIATGVLLGFALASKWTAVYGILLLAVFHAIFNFQFSLRLRSGRAIFNEFSMSKVKGQISNVARGLVVFAVIPVLVYLVAYIPFLTSGHTLEQLWNLQQQMWWYHTGLDATHNYQSTALSWPLMIRPVWYYVKYSEEKVANIYALGNPIIWWGGIAAIAVAIAIRISNFQFPISNKISNFQFSIFKRNNQKTSQPVFQLTILLAAYFAFFLPWVVSPRIMFLYHYMPSLSFLIIILAYMVSEIYKFGQQSKALVYFYLTLVVLVFVYFYPHLSALPVSRDWVEQYFWFSSWK